MRYDLSRKTAPARIGRALALGLACVVLALCAVQAVPAVPAQAATQEELEQQLEELEKKLAEDRAALDAMKKNHVMDFGEAAMRETEQAILVTQQNIEQTQAEIEQKQAEIDAQWDGFKQRMAAMQEMKDCGTMSLLSAVSNLYQFLTFADVIQDVSAKDTEIMDEMQAQLSELAAAKAALEAEKATLEAELQELERRRQELEAQQNTLKAKQAEYAQALVQASENLLSAEDAQKQAQAELDSDMMDYNAVRAEIQNLIGSAAGDHGDLTFSGFILPLARYNRVSSEYGTRTLNGKTKLHAGTDYSAPGGTSIYAAAGGYVCAAGWNSGGYGYYVLIYHGDMGGSTYSTLYAHMQSQPVVSAGSYVSQGQTIGYVGNTGNSYGNHLHIEVWKGSSVSNTVANKATRVDPRYYIPR